MSTLSRPSGAQSTPPAQLTPFIGREREVGEVHRLLRAHRLVTLTGAGGSGKTRLAVEVTYRSGYAFPHGMAWVDLAALNDPALLPRHVSIALGLCEEPERPPLDTLAERLGPLSLLLVLDNCEHLVAACATLAHALLARCPELRILATSREALGIAAETAWLVPPLTLPTPDAALTADAAAHSEAVQLFEGRARAVQPGFRLTDQNAPAVAQICRRLDGIPLAIELAAARARVLAPEQIARRLDDVFLLLTRGSRTAVPRHRTLREAIDWSHALLDEREQKLFRRLAVFLGGFTLEAAEQVSAAMAEEADEVLDLLSALVDKSLVRAEASLDEARFALLETVRQYAAEKLREAGEEEALRRRHAECFLALAETAEPHILGGTRGTEWMDRLERDHGNLRAAAEWCRERDERGEVELRLCAALLWFDFAMGLFQEPRQRLADALSRGGAVAPRVRGRALTALGYQAIWQGDLGAVAPALGEAVGLLRDAGDPTSLAFALTGLGTVVGLGGDGPAAHALFDEAQAALGGEEGCSCGGYPVHFLYAFASYWRGAVAHALGDAKLARESYRQAIAVARRMDDHPTIAHPLAGLGRVMAQEGDLAGARACLAESLPLHAARDDRWGIVQVFEGAVVVAVESGELERAATLLGASDAIREASGIHLPPHEQEGRAGLAERIRARLGDEALRRARSRGREMTIPDAVAEAHAVLGEVEDDGASADRKPEGPPATGGSERAATPAPATAAAAIATSTPGAGPTPSDLRVLALGPLQVFREGELLERDVWGSARPRELLLYLLCRPEGATRDQVGLAFWPDASPAQVSNNFHVTLHRLRKALGRPDWIETGDERYRVSGEITVEFDAAIFESEVESVLRALARGGGPLGPLERALALYRGDFLGEEVVGDWHLDVRDRLRRRYLEGLLALAGRLYQEGRWSEAADAYRRVIACDDLHEEAYRQLMLALAHSGERAEALRLYQRFRLLLAEELDAVPEPETVGVYERLQQGATP